MSLLYTLEGWPNSPSSDNIAHRYNNDTGLWDTGGAPATTPFTGQVASFSNTFRQQGGWDGAFWYVIGPDGKLYRYNPALNTWSAALLSGAVVVSGTIQTQHWCMCSDGRFLYILSSGGDFVRYDPGSDALRTMPTLPGTGYSGVLFLVYDGADALYGFKNGGAGTLVQKYSISTAGWAALPAMPSSVSIGSVVAYAAFLQGSLVVLFQDTGFVYRAALYSPGGNVWTLKSTTAIDLSMGVGAATGLPVYGEDTDATIRVWAKNNNSTDVVYNVLTDAWSQPASNSPVVTQLPGGNWAVARAFAVAFSWFLADGITPANPTVALGLVNSGGLLTYQFVVSTPVACPNGVQLSVPALVTSDAAQPVTVCQTANGAYAASFTTAALTAGQTFTVFVKLQPTTQTAGLTKTLNLRPVRL